MEKEMTLLLIKPDAVNRKLIGTIISRFEQKNFTIAAMKLIHMTRSMAEELYAPHRGKDFFEPTIAFMTSLPIVALVLEGRDIVNQVRKINGTTDPTEAHPGTIRGDFGVIISRNVVHGSDSLENAKREIAIFFNTHEIYPNSSPAHKIAAEV